MNRKTTIVVPVYKDWETLEVCIESLKECVSGLHEVLLVNDMSPEWETMEKNILDCIKGLDNFRYVKNPENLGFVKTCNRAVKLAEKNSDILLLNSDTKVTPGFLEEMIEVLYACERHGAVCPRSSNATILTVPFRKNTTAEFDCQTSYSIYQSIKDKMPRWSVLPTGVGFALLIKREMIERFGLFDEVYSPGYNEENDFCMRINQYGYSIVAANRAYVYHFESKSFESRKNQLDIEHRQILEQRYPYYGDIVNRYIEYGMNPVDYFADLIGDGLYDKRRVLFSLYEMPAAFNGTLRYGLSIFKTFKELYKDKYDIYVLINREADAFCGLSKETDNVFYPDTIIGNTFHVAFSPSQIFHAEHMMLLNKVALKIVFCMQDIISVRSDYLAVNDPDRMWIFRDSIKYCDMMTSISQFSLCDTMAYYSDLFNNREIPTKVIYHGTDKIYKPQMVPAIELPYERYFVIFGNFYKHKNIEPLISVMRNSKYNLIVIGTKEEGTQGCDNVYGYKSGFLSDEFIDYVMGHSLGIIFPSVYEGFGLPFLDAMTYNKKLIVNNTELNIELKNYFSDFSEDNVYVFTYMSEIEEILDKIASNPGISVDTNTFTIRSWKEPARELESCLAEAIKLPVNVALLNERWQYYNYLSTMHEALIPPRVVEVSVESDPANSISGFALKIDRLLKKFRYGMPKIYKIYRRLLKKEK